MMEKIIEILKSVRSDIDYTKEKALVSGSVFDSFDLVSLVTELKDAYDIEISVDDFIPENFDSAEKIAELVERLQDEV